MYAQTLEAISQVVHELVPFGIAGLAIAGIVALTFNPGSGRRWLLMGAMLVIAGIFGFDKYLQPKAEAVQPTTELPHSSGVGNAPITTADVYWFPSGSKGDWGGHDLAHTDGEFPKYQSAKGNVLCDENHIGNIATCWDNRPDGRVPGLDSNVPNSSSRWCTYKDNTIRSPTPPNGYATPAAVYVCAPRIPRA
jgi:hypothetical protein